jgi:hypothetical protein
MASRYQMAHIRPPHIHQLYSSICSTVTPLYRSVEENRWQVPGDSLLHAGVCCKSLASRVLLNGLKKMKITMPILLTRLVTGYGPTVRGYKPPSLELRYRAQWFLFFGAPPVVLEWQANCNRCRRKASCHPLLADTWQSLLISQVTSFGTTVKKNA